MVGRFSPFCLSLPQLSPNSLAPHYFASMPGRVKPSQALIQGQFSILYWTDYNGIVFN
jgi:hypothetical protein